MLYPIIALAFYFASSLTTAMEITTPDNAPRALIIIKNLGPEIVYDADAYSLACTSKEFYKTFRAQGLYYTWSLNLQNIFFDNSSGVGFTPFEKLTQCTKKIEALSQDSVSQEMRSKAAQLLITYKKESCELLEAFESNNQDLRKINSEYRDYQYLCEIYGKEYHEVTLAEHVKVRGEEVGEECCHCCKQGLGICWVCTGGCIQVGFYAIVAAVGIVTCPLWCLCASV